MLKSAAIVSTIFQTSSRDIIKKSHQNYVAKDQNAITEKSRMSNGRELSS